MPAYKKMPSSMRKCMGSECDGCGASNCYAKGGEAEGAGAGGAGGADTSTTGNKTKTGGSNPGGASTGGAGTVTITAGASTRSINVSGVGGTTESRNAGGMDPSDEDDKDTMMANGGEVKADDYLKRRIEENKKTLALADSASSSEMKQAALTRKEGDAYAKGGAVEPDGDEGLDGELSDALGGEFMDAMERKDRKGIMSALEAIVLSCRGKE